MPELVKGGYLLFWFGNACQVMVITTYNTLVRDTLFIINLRL